MRGARGVTVIAALVGALALGLTERDAGGVPAAVSCSTTASTKVRLGGVWSANDGGTYWIRQIGNCLYWTGFSGPLDSPSMGRSFSNVYVGTVGLLTVKGSWADVPRGGTKGSGTLTVRIRSTRLLTKRRTTGAPFTATIWTRTR
jgi:hypothetical protein